MITYENDTLTARVIDLELNEDYVLVDVKTPIGRFAAELKVEYESIIEDIVDKCTKPNIFKFPQTKRLMNAVENKYDADLEFLWEKFPKDAIYRNKNNNTSIRIII